MQKRNMKSDWQLLLLITKSLRDNPIGYSSDDISICHSVFLSHNSILVMCTVTTHSHILKLTYHALSIKSSGYVHNTSDWSKRLVEPDVISFQTLSES
ncbi:hypothetical protein L2E82_11730 [Cichorium intybus]|uniref:Uncharacterized protein n=1 Tax=Cichorium intybus TaxID=13427 RepID=A0ACB9GEU0_CICIN|nr:hypothetical protein L2E82_11730 [Cichorium intybus]